MLLLKKSYKFIINQIHKKYIPKQLLKYMWYPKNKHELNSAVKEYLKTGKKSKPAIGLIVPHAGYEYSGAVAGKAFSVVKNNNIKKAIVIGPSHYVYLFDALT